MQYLNTDRKQGLSGLLRVKDDAPTIAQSIDSCIDALDELIITYNDCTDNSPLIIEEKQRKYPDKIKVIPYPHHVIGAEATEEEYKYGKTLPNGHPQLLATYYNNALQHVNYKYVVKIDADQIYFTKSLLKIRYYIVNGVSQTKTGRFFGKCIYEAFCKRMGNRRIWSKRHPIHYLQYVLVPLFRKQYVKYAVSEFLKGNGYLSLSGVNVVRHNNRWYSPVGSNVRDLYYIWPFNGTGDHLIFEADKHTEYFSWDYTTSLGKNILIERFDFPKEKKLFFIGFFWFHLKLLKEPNYNQIIQYLEEKPDLMIPVEQLPKVSFNRLLKNLQTDEIHFIIRRNCFNFVHNLDRRGVKTNNLKIRFNIKDK